jgi:hypothetical protein
VSVRVKVGPAADHLNEIGAVALALQKHGTLAGAQIDKIIADVGGQALAAYPHDHTAADARVAEVAGAD